MDEKFRTKYQYTNDEGVDVYTWPEADEKGTIDLSYGKISYRLYGKNKNGIPIICVHGGPGGNYGTFYKQLPLAKERPLLLYQQIGSPETELNPKYQTRENLAKIFTIENIAKELDTVILHFNFEKYVLYASSWGTMLVVEYAHEFQPKGLKACILAGSCLNADMWIKDQEKLILSLPNGRQMLDEIHRCQQTGVYTDLFWENDKVYDVNFHNRHHDQTKDRPLMLGYDGNAKPKYDGIDIYEYMWGKAEYSCTGTLKHHNLLHYLNDIQVPFLFIAGEYDEAIPSTVEYYASLCHDAQVCIIPGSGHATANECPEEVSAAIKKFLKYID